MLVTLLGMVREVKPLQPPKAPSLMLVTLLGMVIEVKPLQPRKAYSPMLVTLLLIITFSSEVFPRKSEIMVSQSKTASFKLLQLEKISEPIWVGLH